MTSTVSNDDTIAVETEIQRRDTDIVAEEIGVPHSIAEPTLVTYRSVGIGMFGVVMRYSGMPLEKIALYMNSSQVTGKHQFAQSLRLTFKDGLLAPYRVVGPASLTAWFLQYSVMGFAFQFCDHALSELLGVKPVCYGPELMEPPAQRSRTEVERESSAEYMAKAGLKTFLAPLLASALESNVSNRAEVQRYFGKQAFSQIESRTAANALARVAGPAFLPSAMRNVIMCNTTFILTPITYKMYFPQEKKSASTLFWYGLGMNVFVGNALAITQQALWGRSLDHLARHGSISYGQVVREGLRTDGTRAFFTPAKWCSRVLMNAPAQGLLPWFYNEILPLGERSVLRAVKSGLSYASSPSQGILNGSNIADVVPAAGVVKMEGKAAELATGLQLEETYETCAATAAAASGKALR